LGGIISPDADRAHDALGGGVVDADAAISKEELEGRPAAETIAEGLREIVLAGNA